MRLMSIFKAFLLQTLCSNDLLQGRKPCYLAMYVSMTAKVDQIIWYSRFYENFPITLILLRSLLLNTGVIN